LNSATAVEGFAAARVRPFEADTGVLDEEVKAGMMTLEVKSIDARRREQKLSREEERSVFKLWASRDQRFGLTSLPQQVGEEPCVSSW